MLLDHGAAMKPLAIFSAIEVRDRTIDYTPTLRFFIERGVDVNYTAPEIGTPIFQAIYWNKMDMLKVLLKHDADPMARWDRVTAADYAEESDLLEMCEILKNAMPRRSRRVAQRECKTSLCL